MSGKELTAENEYLQNMRNLYIQLAQTQIPLAELMDSYTDIKPSAPKASLIEYLGDE